MNEHDFESLLKNMPPAAPSSALFARVEHELELDNEWLGATNRHKRLPTRWLAPVGWSALGAAAAIALMVAMPGQTPSSIPGLASSASVSSVMPVTTIREMVDAQDEGIQYNAKSKLPEQHVKLVSVERHAWIDPRDGAEITVEMPREDSVILPVSFQ